MGLVDLPLLIYPSSTIQSKKSPTVGPTVHGPRKKPEYLIARSQLTEGGSVGKPIQFLMDSRLFAPIFRCPQPSFLGVITHIIIGGLKPSFFMVLGSKNTIFRCRFGPRNLQPSFFFFGPLLEGEGC